MRDQIAVAMHWWYIPIALTAIGAWFFYKGSQQSGWLGGFFESILAAGLVFAAIVSLLVGWLAS